MFPGCRKPAPAIRERDFFTDNLLVRIHFIIVMIRWTGLAPWEFEFPFPGSLTFTFLVPNPVSLALCNSPGGRKPAPVIREQLLSSGNNFCHPVTTFITQSKVVAKLTLLVAVSVLHRSCSVAAEPLHR